MKNQGGGTSSLILASVLLASHLFASSVIAEYLGNGDSLIVESSDSRSSSQSDSRITPQTAPIGVLVNFSTGEPSSSSSASLSSSSGSAAVPVSQADYGLGVSAPCAKTILGDQAGGNLGVQTISCDINNDGRDDFIIAAPYAAAGQFDSAGVVSVFYGNANFVGDTIDIQFQLPDVILHGSSSDEFVGEALAFGDVNGDGIADLVIGAPGARNEAGGGKNTGRTYIVFGSSSLQQDIDLRLEANVVVFGEEVGPGSVPDHAGSSVAVGIINADGFADILISVPGADGSGNSRLDAGEYHVLYGRTTSTWPATMTLGVNSDETIYGPRAADGTYNLEGSPVRAMNTCAIGDIDGNGAGDIVLSVPGDDGIGSAFPEIGSVRLILNEQLVSPFDLLSSIHQVFYGAESEDVLATVHVANLDGDIYDDIFMVPLNANGLFNGRTLSNELYIHFGKATIPILNNAHFDADAVYYPSTVFKLLSQVAVGDFNNSGSADLAFSLLGGSGPDNSVGGGGEVWVIFDPGHVTGFIDMQGLTPDALVYGSIAGDRIGVGLSVGDVNNDGFDDLLIGAPSASFAAGQRIGAGKGFLASGEMMTIGDRDGDGSFACLDNCPLTANSSQLDTDSDGIGDACDNCALVSNTSQADFDGDTVGDACDNCPNSANAEQYDNDGDGIGNLCDVCKFVSDPAQTDTDGDGFGDSCDPCPTDNLNLCCTIAGDVDNSGSLNIADVTRMIAHVFTGGPGPVLPGTDDVNCSGGFNIIDVTYLIDLIFTNGPLPCCMP